MRLSTLVLFQLFSLGLFAQINKIEHFYVSSTQTENLFQVFRDSLNLPVVWDYEKGEYYSSGGLWLGNIVLEFSDYPPIDKTRFKGIGLEPGQSIQSIETILTSNQLAHDPISSYIVDSVKHDTSYSVIMFDYLLPSIKMFICEYGHKKEYDGFKQKVSDKMLAMQADKLGITGLREIVIGCNDVRACKSELLKIPGIRNDGDLFAFNDGPAIRLTKADSIGVTKIVVSVKDIQATEKYLQQTHMSAELRGHNTTLDSKLVDGLIVEFADK
jgi:hypothetical protein